ncbi:MAG: hypothetical protein M9897_10710 [Brumimicrobium sp.]|nr:hypothetical protein [Brumimicrobium sp.]
MKNILLSLLVWCVAIFVYAQESQDIAFNYSKNLDKQYASVSLHIVKSNDKYEVKYVNWSVVKTRVQIDRAKSGWKQNDFVCFVLDENDQVIDTIIIQHPLQPQDDMNTSKAQAKEILENTVSIYFKYSDNMKFLSIYKVEEDNNLIMINTLIIPQGK